MHWITPRIHHCSLDSLESRELHVQTQQPYPLDSTQQAPDNVWLPSSGVSVNPGGLETASSPPCAARLHVSASRVSNPFHCRINPTQSPRSLPAEHHDVSNYQAQHCMQSSIANMVSASPARNLLNMITLNCGTTAGLYTSPI